jgi:small conductance mechanosensitive channel
VPKPWTELAPEEQYGVSREIRERVKAAFDEQGIKAPAFTPFGPPAR